MNEHDPRYEQQQIAVSNDTNAIGSSKAIALHTGNLHEVQDDLIDLRALWRTLVRYRKLIGMIVGVFLLTTLTLTLLLRPMYTASVTIEINTSGRNLVKFQNLETQDFSSKEFLYTQAKILESAPVAAEVIKRLNLLAEPEFTGELKQRGVLSGVKSIISLFRDKNIAQEEAVRIATNIYLGRLTVNTLRNSSLAKINFESFSPELAAKIANEHGKAYIWLNDQRRFSSTSGAKKFLESEISVIQGKLESSEKSLTEFARTHGVIDLEDSNNIMMARLTDLNQSLAEVQNQRIDAETKFKQSKVASADELATVYDDPLIKALREQQAEVDAEYNRLSSIYKPKYPTMVQLRDKSDEIESSIYQQTSKVISGLKNIYEQLVERERVVQVELEKLKVGLLNLKDRSIAYNILKREWEANKELYANLLERTKEVGVAAGMELNIASIVDPATDPRDASSPNLKLNVLLALIAGLGLGCAAALLLTVLDNTVNDIEQLEHLSQLGSLGVVPAIETAEEQLFSNKMKKETLVHDQPSSGFSEAIQSVRTSLQFARAGGFPKSIMVTSAVASEGKSTIAINLAISCAKSGKNVILVEADFRKARHYKVFGMPSSPGLTDALVEQSSSATSYRVEQVDGLSMIVAGSKTSSPSDLLSSIELKKLLDNLHEAYDLVIIDAPPVLGLADALIISKMVESAIFVVAGHDTPKDTVSSALQRLRTVNAPLIGTILNKFDSNTVGYDYFSYDYGQIEEDSTADAA